jgi:hypothetical protein
MKKYKIHLSLASILLVILIVLLLPKRNKSEVIEPPRTGVRRITPAPTSRPENSLSVTSQKPDKTIKIDYVDFKEGGIIKIIKFGKEIGASQQQTGVKENLTIDLIEQTIDGEIVSVVLYTKEGSETERKDILITTTAVSPGVLLPKDLQ